MVERRRHASQKSKRPSSASQAAQENSSLLKAAGNEVPSTMMSSCGVGSIAIDVGGDSVSVMVAATGLKEVLPSIVLP